MFPSQSPHANTLPSGDTLMHRIASVISLYIKPYFSSSVGMTVPSSVRSSGGALRLSKKFYTEPGVCYYLISMDLYELLG